MKRGVFAVGIDANPSSCFAARVKTNWSLKPARLLNLLLQVRSTYGRMLEARPSDDPTFRYLASSGMLKRGWISKRPLDKALALKASIHALRTSKAYRDALMLALVSEVISSASNIRFGPEPYCGPKKRDSDLLNAFTRRVRNMAQALEVLAEMDVAEAAVFEGDSRHCGEVLPKSTRRRFSAIICSPPYPAEHDYTRHSRLELSFLGAVSNRETLQNIKKAMLRSHTKGIYKGDNDNIHLRRTRRLDRIVSKGAAKAATKTHGFARLYSTVIQEYFGGMKRHLTSVFPLLSPGANCAYVVGDQSCYLQVHIPTAQILSEIATDVGFVNVSIEHWRTRRSTTTSRMIDENILLFKKPLA
jgi:hypothetical protein